MNTFEIREAKIKVGDVDVVLTLGEIRILRDLLNKLLGEMSYSTVSAASSYPSSYPGVTLTANPK